MLRRCLLLSLAALAALPSVALAQSADGLTTKTLYAGGPSGRYLMGGTWLQRLDPGDTGSAQGFTTSASTAGWNQVTVPNAWNATDHSDASFAGGVGWYRKDF